MNGNEYAVGLVVNNRTNQPENDPEQRIFFISDRQNRLNKIAFSIVEEEQAKKRSDTSGGALAQEVSEDVADAASQ